jgi:hypothetical protein
MKTKAVDNAIRRAAAKHAPLSDIEAEQRGIKVDKDGLVRCRVCGCTEREPCNPPCLWVEVDLCSGCGNVVATLAEWRESALRPNVAALMREFKAHWEDAFRTVSRRARGVGR